MVKIMYLHSGFRLLLLLRNDDLTLDGVFLACQTPCERLGNDLASVVALVERCEVDMVALHMFVHAP